MNIHNEFAKWLLIKAWLPNDENLPMLIEDVLTTFYDWSMTQLMKKLDKLQLDLLWRMVEKESSDEEIYDMLNQNIPDFDNVMESLYDEFEKLYLTKVQENLNKNK